MSRKKNPVWEFFDIEIGAPQFAICKVCRAKISRGNPAKPADFSPTAMVKHMGQHPAEQKIIADKVHFFPGSSSSFSLKSIRIRYVQFSFHSCCWASFLHYNHIRIYFSRLLLVPFSFLFAFSTDSQFSPYSLLVIGDGYNMLICPMIMLCTHVLWHAISLINCQSYAQFMRCLISIMQLYLF